jgi:biotin operon repressor
MDKATFNNIQQKAPLIEEYAQLPVKLREIAKFMAGPSRKDLIAIADSMERLSVQLFHPSLARALELYHSPAASQAKSARALGVSESTIRQTMMALRAGGIDIGSHKGEQAKATSKASTSERGLGAAYINEETSNEDRMDEAARAVEEAVSILAQDQNWETLSKRKRITLIQEQTRKTRGVAISTQTLYRPWVKNLW